eukprot:859389-Amphidinium_carterae.1
MLSWIRTEQLQPSHEEADLTKSEPTPVVDVVLPILNIFTENNLAVLNEELDGLDCQLARAEPGLHDNLMPAGASAGA